MTPVSKSAASSRAIKAFEETFTKKYGEGTMSTPDINDAYDVISTGSLALDDVLGVAGIVEGKITEIWGKPGVGKTTLCLMMCAEAQKKHPDKLVAWVDMEHAFDVKWAAAHGINIEGFKHILPGSAEDVADVMKDIAMSGLFSLVVLDSIGAMITEKDIDRKAEETSVAAVPKVVTRMVEILAVKAAVTSTAIVLINQVRANITAYGADTRTGGGFALEHSSTMKLNVSRTGTSPFTDKINGEDRIVGHEIKVKVERNRVAIPHRLATLTLFNQPSKWGPIGIDLPDEAFTVGFSKGIITLDKTTYVLPDGTRNVGRPKTIEYLRENPDVVQQIREQVLAASLVYNPEEAGELVNVE
jgi:recombination protein RecA